MLTAFAYGVIGLVVAALLVLGGVLRGRTARHEDGDEVARRFFTESSGPDGDGVAS